MATHKNISSDVASALSVFGIDNFLVLGLQEVPGSGERREIWALSTKDPNAFREGLIKLFLEHGELVRLFATVIHAGDLCRRMAEVEARTQKQEGKA